MTKTVSFKGKKYPIRIGYKALKAVNRDLGRDFRGGEEQFDYEGAEALLFYGLKQGAEFADKEFTLKKEQMEDVLDESMAEFLDSFEAFSQPPQKGA